MSRTSVFSKVQLGRTHGDIQTGSQNQRNPNAPTFEEKSIEWTLSMEEKQGKQLKLLHKNVHKVPGTNFVNRHGSSSRVPRAMFLHLVKLHRNKENSVDSGASFHMMSDSDLTPKEQETIQHSKDPSVILTANGTTHTTEEATCKCV